MLGRESVSSVSWQLPSFPMRRRARLALIVLGVVAAVAVIVFMTYDLKGSLSFALELRARKVAGMAIVGVAIAYSAVLFHTTTHNRILTPSLMGFDSLYVLIQTVAVFLLGSASFLSIDPRLRFGLEVLLMLGLASMLYRLLFRRENRDLFMLVLAGIIIGTIFASMTSLLSRLIDPNEFTTLQDLLFANFSTVNRELLVVAGGVTVGTIAFTANLLRRLDVIALGREHAVSLGVDYHSVVRRYLVAIAVLVSASTALVGPVAFLGLLVSNLAYQFTGTFRHRVTLPAAALIAVIALVGGQFILQEVFNAQTRLSVIVSFVGGIYFILLLLRESRR